MTQIYDEFLKVKSAWPSASISLDLASYPNVDRGVAFELAYHASNDVPYRCIKIELFPDKENVGNRAVLYSSAKKLFVEIESKETETQVTCYCEDQEELKSKITIIEGGYKKWAPILSEDPGLKYKYATMILSRKTDEVIHNSMIPTMLGRLFSIGEQELCKQLTYFRMQKSTLS